MVNKTIKKNNKHYYGAVNLQLLMPNWGSKVEMKFYNQDLYKQKEAYSRQISKYWIDECNFSHFIAMTFKYLIL